MFLQYVLVDIQLKRVMYIITIMVPVQMIKPSPTECVLQLNLLRTLPVVNRQSAIIFVLKDHVDTTRNLVFLVVHFPLGPIRIHQVFVILVKLFEHLEFHVILILLYGNSVVKRLDRQMHPSAPGRCVVPGVLPLLFYFSRRHSVILAIGPILRTHHSGNHLIRVKLWKVLVHQRRHRHIVRITIHVVHMRLFVKYNVLVTRVCVLLF